MRLEAPDGRAHRHPRPPYVPEGKRCCGRPAGDIAIVGTKAPDEMQRPPGGKELPSGVPGLEARVELQSFLGNLSEYRVQAGDVSLRVQTDKKVQIREGAKVRLVIRERAAAARCWSGPPPGPA